jgi:two-component system response regulator TctD
VRRWRPRAGPLAASLPDVVLLDLSLPGLDGLQVLAARARRGLDAGAHPHRARHGGRPHPGPEHRRGRLPAQALRPRRTGSPGARPGAPRGVRSPAQRDAGASSAACAATSPAAPSTCTARPGPDPARGGPAARPAGPSRPRVAKERLFELVFAGEADVQADAIEVVVYRLRKKLARTAPNWSRCAAWATC